MIKSHLQIDLEMMQDKIPFFIFFCHFLIFVFATLICISLAAAAVIIPLNNSCKREMFVRGNTPIIVQKHEASHHSRPDDANGKTIAAITGVFIT